MDKCPNCLPECECRPPEDTCPVPADEDGEEDDNMHESFPTGDDWCIRNLLM